MGRCNQLKRNCCQLFSLLLKIVLAALKALDFQLYSKCGHIVCLLCVKSCHLNRNLITQHELKRFHNRFKFLTQIHCWTIERCFVWKWLLCVLFAKRQQTFFATVLNLPNRISIKYLLLCPKDNYVILAHNKMTTKHYFLVIEINNGSSDK